MTADRLDYREEDGRVTATGAVEINRGTYRLLADRVTYDPKRDRVMADGNVVLIEPGGDAYFGTALDVTGDLKDGFIEGVRLLRTDNSRLAANRAVRQGGTITTLDRAVYSPCPVCAQGDGHPLWQIKAREVVDDSTAQTITFHDAVMDLLGVPVLYTPTLSFPEPGVKRKSGFLPPTFGSKSDLGLLTSTPYFQTLGPDRDFTFAPIFTQNEGPVLAGQYREVRAIGRTELGGSLTYATGNKRNEGDDPGQTLRGHLRGQGRYPLGNKDKAGFDLFLASDNTYLDRYDFSSEDRLENRAYAEFVPGRDFYGFDGYYFQGLREDDNQDRIPIALPVVDANVVSGPLIWGSHLTLDANLLALTRLEGLDTRRASVEGGWSLPFQGPIGDVWEVATSLRGDLYLTEGDPQTFSSTGGTGQSGRLVPRLTVNWNWPWIGDGLGWGWTVAPVAAFNLSPGNENPDGIPNEDSRDFEFDDTNLLEPVRYPGLDRNEGGGKLAYGVRTSGVGPRGLEINGLIGQSWRFFGHSPFAPGSGLSDPLSDYVGRVGVRPASWLDLGFRFRLDKDSYRFKRSSLETSAGPDWLKVDLDYVNLSQGPSESNATGFESREEILVGGRVRLNDRLELGARTRQDLSRGATVANQVGLIYTHPCLVLTVGAERSYTGTADVKDDTTVLVRLAFKNLGELQTGGLPGL